MNTTHGALQIIYQYNTSYKINEMEKNKTNGTYSFHKENQIVAKAFLSCHLSHVLQL